MKQRGRRRGDGVEDGSRDGGMESAAVVKTPVESRTTTGMAQRRRLPVASAHPQIGLGYFGGFGGAR